MTKPTHKTIFRVHRAGGFTVIPNATLRDARMSFKARGILAMILSNTDEWTVNQKWLATCGPDGRESIRSGIEELERCGYMTREKVTQGGKWMGTIYTFFDIPQAENTQKTEETTECGFPAFGKTAPGKPAPSEEQSQKTSLQKKSCGPAEPAAHRNEKPNLTSERTPPEPAAGGAAVASETPGPTEDAPLGGQKAVAGHPGANLLVAAWHDEFRATFATPYVGSGGADGRAAKDLLRQSGMSVVEIMAVARAAWAKRDSFWCRQSLSLRGFASRFTEIRSELSMLAARPSTIPVVGRVMDTLD